MRLRIWRATFPKRDHRLAWYAGEGEDWRESRDVDELIPEYYLPITLHVNQESRDETKRYYIDVGGDYGLINLSLDFFVTGDRNHSCPTNNTTSVSLSLLKSTRL